MAEPEDTRIEKRISFSIQSILESNKNKDECEDSGSANVVRPKPRLAANDLSELMPSLLLLRPTPIAPFHPLPPSLLAAPTPRRLGHPYTNRTPPKRKKPRTSFSRSQICELEKRFLRQKYLASTERASVAKNLRMTDAQVKTWFQNRRTKWRRQTAEEREQERQAAAKYFFSMHLGALTATPVSMATPINVATPNDVSHPKLDPAKEEAKH